MLLSIRNFFVLLAIASVNILYYSFAHSLHYIQDINFYKDENSSTIVGSIVGASVGMLINTNVIIVICYTTSLY